MDSLDEHPINYADDQSTDDCTICYDPLNIITDIEITPCMHMFHTTCYREWLQRASTCPLCRSSLQREYINHQRGYIRLDDFFRNMFHSLPPIPDIDNSTTWRRIRIIPFISQFTPPEESTYPIGMRIGEMDRDNLFDEPTGPPLDRDLISSLSGGDSTSSRLDYSRLYNEPGVARAAVLRNEIRQVRVDYTPRSRIFNPDEPSEYPRSRIISNDSPTIEPLVETFQVQYRQHTNFASETINESLERLGRDDYLEVNQPVVQPPRRNRSTKQTHYHHIRQARNQFRQYARR